ncbi:MAG: sulfotransferase, partial [Akkermansiaceae bacterium]
SAAIKNRLARFGCTEFNRKALIEHYFLHQAEVTSFFADKPDRLLVVDLTRATSWQPICSFLGIQEPSIPFPHEH